jgi:hypothetical protein
MQCAPSAGNSGHDDEQCALGLDPPHAPGELLHHANRGSPSSPGRGETSIHP